MSTNELAPLPRNSYPSTGRGEIPGLMQRQVIEQRIKFESMIADLRLDLSRARAELAAMHRHCAVLAQRVEIGAPDVIELRRELAALLESTSWRMTRPLRVLGRLLQEVGVQTRRG